MEYSANDYRYYLAHHGVKNQKWGQRNGPPYPLKESVKAAIIHKEAKSRVNKITEDVSSTVTKVGGKMYGLDHKLKTPESIARKLKLNKEIKDAVRFTVVSSESEFVDNYFKIKDELINKGYSETKCKNYFQMYKEGKVKHKAVQTNYRTDDGYEFEIQFQTPSSQHAKDLKVPLYEEVRNPKTSDERQAVIEKEMEKLAADVKDPIGIEKIKSH